MGKAVLIYRVGCDYSQGNLFYAKSSRSPCTKISTIYLYHHFLRTLIKPINSTYKLRTLC